MRSWSGLLAMGFILSTGCGGDGEAEPSYELTTGTYAISDMEVEIDGCELDPESFTTQSVAVNGDVVTLGFLELTRDGNRLEGDGTTILDMTPTDCFLDLQGIGSGKVIGTDAFDLALEAVATVDSGTECGDLGIIFPCSSEYSFRAEK